MNAGLHVQVARLGSGYNRQFQITCIGVAETVQGVLSLTQVGELICKRLEAAFPELLIQLKDDVLLILDRGNHEHWDDLQVIDIHRAVLDLEKPVAEFGPGPEFREFGLRTSRPLHVVELVVLQSLHLSVTLINEDYGGGPLYRIVPKIGEKVDTQLIWAHLHPANDRQHH